MTKLAPRPARVAETLALALLATGAPQCDKAPRANADAGDAQWTDASPAPGGTAAPASSKERDGASPGAFEVGTAPSIQLLSPGRPPRRRLRYAWRVGQREALALDLRTTATTQEGSASSARVPLPPVHIGIAIDPTAVTADGELKYAWRVTSTAVGAEEGTAESLVEGMRAEVAAVAALAGSGTVSSLGLTGEIAVDASSVPEGGATGQMIEQVRQTLRDLPAPFPDEEVGVGARWQKLSDVGANGIPVHQTETFTLARVEGDRGSVENVLAQTAPAQALHTPGMAPGAQAEMESMLVAADATTRFDLTRLVPQMHLVSTTTMVLSGHSAGDSPRRVAMALRVEILLEGTLVGSARRAPR